MDELNRADTAFKHIYDPGRVALAVTIIEKELHKLFLGLPEEAWPAITASVRGWAECPEKYHLSGEQLRDFWDGFAAVVESIKLKPNFTALVTAENAHWQRASIPVRDIVVTHALEQLEKVPGLHFQKFMPAGEVIDALSKDAAAAKEQKRINDGYSPDPRQDEYPIIVRQAGEHRYHIVDGNRRTLRAALLGRQSIDAWVFELVGGRPINYWIPLNDLLQLVKIYKSASGPGAKLLKRAVARVLRSRFQASPLAEHLYKIRIAAYDEAAQQLYELASQLKGA